MRFASDDAPSRADYIDVADGVSVPFQHDRKPLIIWGHIDGPLLHSRDGQLHWLTYWERFQCWLGRADAFTLERKYAPEFVDRWDARVQRERYREFVASRSKPARTFD